MSRKYDSLPQVRLDLDVALLLKRYGEMYPIESTNPKLANGILRVWLVNELRGKISQKEFNLIAKEAMDWEDNNGKKK